jgi:Mg-chelatase subunit ChlI
MPRTAPEPVPRADSLTPVTQALRQFRQVILYGPLGTGKTRLARRAALALLENHESVVPSPEDEASVSERLSYFRKQGDFDLVVFHRMNMNSSWVESLPSPMEAISVTRLRPASS